MTDSENNWGVTWSSIEFFKRVLSTHTAVETFEQVNDIQFEIVRRNRLSDVNAILVEDYMLGEATVYAILKEFDGVTAIVNNGTWNHIALDWKGIAKQTGVVVFGISDFLGALNVNQLDKYTTPDEREERRRKRRKSS